MFPPGPSVPELLRVLRPIVNDCPGVLCRLPVAEAAPTWASVIRNILGTKALYSLPRLVIESLWGVVFPFEKLPVVSRDGIGRALSCALSKCVVCPRPVGMATVLFPIRS